MKRILLATVATMMFPLVATAQISPAPPGPPGIPAQISSATSLDSSTDASGTPGMAKLSLQDSHFIKVAAIAGMSEVNDGKLAASMGDSSVQNIGTTMVADHSKANDKLLSIVKQKNATAPMQVDASHAAVTAQLKTLKGASFDHEYLKTELKGHIMTIAAFKAEASTGSDPDLKSFASDTLPTLEQHLAMIKAAMK